MLRSDTEKARDHPTLLFYRCLQTTLKLSGIKQQPFDHIHKFCGSGIWTEHSRDGLSLLSDVWNLGWKDLNGWGLESSGDFFTHMSGTWTRITGDWAQLGLLAGALAHGLSMYLERLLTAFPCMLSCLTPLQPWFLTQWLRAPRVFHWTRHKSIGFLRPRLENHSVTSAIFCQLNESQRCPAWGEEIKPHLLMKGMPKDLWLWF